MNYEIVTLTQKTIVGVSARTGNASPDCIEIIGGLWRKFLGEGIWDGIQSKANTYCIGLYSGYDETAYDVTVGAEVTANENPAITQKIIPAGHYAKFHVTGDVVKDVAAAWDAIWALPLDRSYLADFEEYLKNENGVAEVDLYIALKD